MSSVSVEASTSLSVEDLNQAAAAIRGLSMDGVEAANSGHPGMPMGMADVASVLWLKYLKHNPANPSWSDRDRFVLSAGHGSMLIYSLLHLAGYDLPIEELQNFRQWESKTPGHPEYGETVGVETTTGPLGQGSGNAVGMALAEAMLAARYNGKGGFDPVDHYTYVIAGDGCLMEGLSHEAFSLAGHLGLNKLVVFFDNNSITIEGDTSLACSDNTRARFEGYNWNVIEIDGHDYAQIEAAIEAAHAENDRPTIVITTTTIGYSAPTKAGTHGVHGAPIGPDEIRGAKEMLGLPVDQDFYVSDEVRALFAARKEKLGAASAAWDAAFAEYRSQNPELAERWDAGEAGTIPEDLDAKLPAFEVGTAIATRKASEAVIQNVAEAIPALVGGSADLAPSTNTLMKAESSVGPGAFEGRNLHYGIREHAMCAVMNGMALHGGFRVYGATFFTFVDYCKPSLRLAALMKIPTLYIFTHDSFYVGEDGPTHQPVEHLATVRAIPGFTVIRPSDPTETAAAWAAALRNTTGPTAIILTRHNLKVIDRSVYPAASELEKGAYTLSQSGEGTPDLILIGTGSEVETCMGAAEQLAAAGTNVRVVSMPSWELFDAQDAAYRESVLPTACGKRLAVEAGCSMGWDRYVGAEGKTFGFDRFGASAPAGTLAEKFGFTPDNIAKVAKALLG